MGKRKKLERKIHDLGFICKREKLGDYEYIRKTDEDQYGHRVCVRMSMGDICIRSSFGIDNMAIPLSLEETRIFYKMAKQLERKWKRNKNGK